MKLTIPDTLLPTLFYRSSEKNIDFERYIAGLFTQVAEKIHRETTTVPSIEQKIALTEWIILGAYRQFGGHKLCLAWTGGKDSTFLLWLARRVAHKHNFPLPHCMFINEGHIFEEINDFVKKITKEWKLSVTKVQNDDVLKQVNAVGNAVTVAKLDKQNQQEVKRLGYTKKSFPFEPESKIGNHLMKTVAMNRFLAKTNYDAVITGIRWDEQEARKNELYFSERGDEFTPLHTRVHPILHLTEKNIWEAIHAFDIPYCSLYKEGYRSLGAKGTTTKADNKPAWEQNFEVIPERAGRRQDKENVMDSLRKLGYM